MTKSMKISGTMDLEDLVRAVLMPITLDEAKVLRNLLVAKFDGVDVEDVPQADWDQCLGDSIFF
jgi:hypothetical protein